MHTSVLLMEQCGLILMLLLAIKLPILVLNVVEYNGQCLLPLSSKHLRLPVLMEFVLYNGDADGSFLVRHSICCSH